MIRVRKLKLSNHPVLGNLELDFTDSSNKAVDTVIIAGNNGIGKSSLVELLYQIMAHKYHDMPCYVDSIEVEYDSEIRTYKFYAKDINGSDYLYVKDGLGLIIGWVRINLPRFFLLPLSSLTSILIFNLNKLRMLQAEILTSRLRVEDLLAIFPQKSISLSSTFRRLMMLMWPERLETIPMSVFRDFKSLKEFPGLPKPLI